jgi:hypothetical protein
VHACAASAHAPRDASRAVRISTRIALTRGRAAACSARAAQFLELRAFLGRMVAAAGAAGLRVRGALLAGDLNCAAGSAEALAALSALRAPHTRDLAEPAHGGAGGDDATFPLGAWARKRSAYARATPHLRLDFLLDVSPAARPDRQPLAHAAAAVECGIAEDDNESSRAAALSFGLLSDHAALVAAVALPR